MEWIELYDGDKQPSEAQIAEYIASPLWTNLIDFLRENYDVQPSYSYSKCSSQPGWNIQYKKAGRSLCTLYPMSGFFIALVTIGAKEEMEAELLMPILTDYVQELMKTAGRLMGARWLMIHITDEKVLDDVKCLVQIRRKIKRREK